jgi:hypothetical protein
VAPSFDGDEVFRLLFLFHLVAAPAQRKKKLKITEGKPESIKSEFEKKYALC